MGTGDESFSAMIDVHVHILWHFGKDGRFDNRGETPEDRIQAGIENARVTVMPFTPERILKALRKV